MVLVGSEGLWHRTRMMRLNCYLLVLAGGLAAASGCRSSKSNVVQPMPDSALRAIFAKAQDPRRYWLTPYGSEEGTYFANAHRVHPEQVVERAFISPKNSLSPVLLFDQMCFVNKITSPHKKKGKVLKHVDGRV